MAKFQTEIRIRHSQSPSGNIISAKKFLELVEWVKTYPFMNDNGIEVVLRKSDGNEFKDSEASTVKSITLSRHTRWEDS